MPGAAEIPTLANIVPLCPDWHHAAVPGEEESQRFRSWLWWLKVSTSFTASISSFVPCVNLSLNVRCTAPFSPTEPVVAFVQGYSYDTPKSHVASIHWRTWYLKLSESVGRLPQVSDLKSACEGMHRYIPFWLSKYVQCRKKTLGGCIACGWGLSNPKRFCNYTSELNC